MKKATKKLLILFIALAALSIYFTNGGTIALGDIWKDEPADCLLDDEYNINTEIKTVYLGENGEDGAMVFSIHKYLPENISTLELSLYKTKKKSGQYLYTSYSSYEYTTETINNGELQLHCLTDAVLDNYAIFIIDETDDERLYREYPQLKESEIHTVKFETDNKEYQIKYIVEKFESKKEAQSFKDSFS